MKLLIYADPHWCQYSSIIRSRGEKYSTRLEHEIESINFVEKLAGDHNCDHIICLGDFFDRSTLNSEEVSALNEIAFSSIPKVFLVGNHEINSADNTFNSANVFNFKGQFDVISKITTWKFLDSDNRTTFLSFIPYLLESDTFDLRAAFNDDVFKNKDRHIIFSHNDIKGIRYGRIESKHGFDQAAIKKCCSLFINGHIHNGSIISNEIINLGTLVGQNFSEDANVYSHNALLLDTTTLTYELIENPYAFNFYKMQIDDINFENLDFVLKNIKNNAIVSVSCRESYIDALRKILEDCPNILDYRIIQVRDVIENSSSQAEKLIVVNHIDQFKSYILNTLGENNIVLEELGELQ